jgi:hypothetical protein
MIAKITKQIQNDLIAALHPANVEAVYNYLPQTVTERKTIAVVRRGKAVVSHEIGQKLGSLYRYRVSVIVIVAHTDYETAIADLDSLERKVVENLSLNSNLLGLTDTEAGHTERVLKWNLLSTEYPEVMPPLDKTVQCAIIEIEVDTEVHPS